MKSRVIASLALSAAVVLGATGCSMISPQATTIPYSAAEGVNVPHASGPLAVRNAFIVANESGTLGNLVAAIVNDTDQDETLTIEIEGVSASKTVDVPANSVVSLGSEDTDPLLILGLNAKPGTDTPVFFQSGEGEGALVSAPILDGELPYLADLVPSVVAR